MKETRIFSRSFILALLSSIYALYAFLGTNLIAGTHVFDTDHLRDLSTRSIELHGNDTAAIVANIVDGLRSDSKLAPHLAVEEEWVLNNAGGAMGAMYIIHASKQFIYT